MRDMPKLNDWRPGTRFAIALPLVLALALTTGCAADSPVVAGDLTTTIDTVDGVIRVTNSGTAPEWQLTHVVSIGPKSLLVGDGGPEEFGQVTSADLGPENEVFVGDTQNGEVRVFGLDGRHSRTFGRFGEGPGEFTYITSLAWVGDRLLALDLIGGRVVEFSSDGRALGLRNATGFWGGEPGVDRFYPVGADEAYSVGLVFDGTEMSRAYIGQNSAGETGDTLYPREQPWDHRIRCEYNNGWSSSFDIVYSRRLIEQPGTDGVMYEAWTDAYRIAVTRGADTLRIIERALSPEPISDEEWASATEEFEIFRKERPRASCDPRRPVRPATKPFIDDIFIAADGRLWVEVMRTGGNRWEVFDPEGRLLAEVPLVEWKEGSVPAFRTDYQITIRQDSLDLDHVDVWKIEKGGG